MLKELHALIKKTAHGYTLDNNTLYKLKESRQGTLGTTRGRQHRNHLIVPPRTQLPHLLRNHHDHHLAGHQAKENTYQKIAEQYYWPGMKKDVTEYVQTCKTCQKRSRQKGEAPLNPITKHPIPFHQVGIDVVSPLPRTLTGY
jgi:hypothetical protein